MKRNKIIWTLAVIDFLGDCPFFEFACEKNESSHEEIDLKPPTPYSNLKHNQIKWIQWTKRELKKLTFIAEVAL